MRDEQFVVNDHSGLAEHVLDLPVGAPQFMHTGERALTGHPERTEVGVHAKRLRQRIPVKIHLQARHGRVLAGLLVNDT